MAVEQAATAGTPGGGGIWPVLAAPLRLRTWTATVYLLASMFVGLAWFVILVTGLSLGLGLLIVWVGVLVLALTLLAWRGGAWLERRWVRLMLGVQIPEPYRPLPAGSLWRRARVLAGDPATWKDLAYLVLLFPLGLVWFVVTTTLWTFALGLLTAPLWYWTPSEGGLALLVNGERSYLVIDTLPEALLATVAGAVLVVAAAWAVRAMATAQGALALALLGPSDSQLRARVEALQASRDRAVEGAISALAARSPVPVGVEVTAGRLPGPVESTAYFVVAEALANAAKHARAAEIGVRITRHRDLLIVEVIDDGVGGADPGKGSGLRGLADRVGAVDGHLTITSPPGGPTVIRAELPCES
jgi:hypothetical protein